MPWRRMNGQACWVDFTRICRCPHCGVRTVKVAHQRTPPGAWCFEHWKKRRSKYMMAWYKTEVGRLTLNRAVSRWRKNNPNKWNAIMKNYRVRNSANRLK